MITLDRVIEAENTGMYQFPFKKNSFIGNAVIDHTVTFEDFILNNDVWFAKECNGVRRKYTLSTMQAHWNCIVIQRKTLLSALMVVDGEVMGINDGLKRYGIF